MLANLYWWLKFKDNICNDNIVVKEQELNF